MFPVYIRVGRTNRDKVALADSARRQANYIGPDGWRAMRGQTDALFRKNGHLRLVFKNRSNAIAFQQRVDEVCDPAIITERRRIQKNAGR